MRAKHAKMTLDDDDSITVEFSDAEGRRIRTWSKYDLGSIRSFLTNDNMDRSVIDDCLKSMQEEKSGRYLRAIGKAASALRFHSTYPDITEPAREELRYISSVLTDLEAELITKQLATPASLSPLASETASTDNQPPQR